METGVASRGKHKKQKKNKKGDEIQLGEESNPASSIYKPPEGFKLISASSDYGVFDWDTLDRNPNLEIWAVRIPAGLKPKHLNNMSFPLPSRMPPGGGELARITTGKNQTQYSISSVSSSTGGEELKSVSCLLPKASKDGKLYPGKSNYVSRPISGHLIISELQSTAPSEPNSLHAPREVEALPLPSSKRYSHPDHLLKHKYVPTAVSIEQEASTQQATGGLDVPARSPETYTSGSIYAHALENPTKRPKKRKKDEEGTSQKAKKLKAM
ncbi:hypothetical protein FRC17_011034 [Serendipita sp. 399]|nr:hypothetical protein FRC17_011034 [Serendipita sp. 399]